MIPTIAITGVSINPASGAQQTFIDDIPVTYTVTAADTSTQDYFITVTKAPASNIATVTSTQYTVNTAGNVGTITGIPSDTSLNIFHGNLVMGESHQTWNEAGIHDPVLSNDTLLVTAEDGSTQVTYTITVVPAMTGTVAITGTTKYGEILTADVSGLINGGAPNVLMYEWRRVSTNTVIGTNSATYTLVQADIGSTVTVKVTADGVHAAGNVTSLPTSAVTKANGPAAPDVPIESSHTSTSVTLVANALNEFTKDDGLNW